jgi:hypothetical protein
MQKISRSALATSCSFPNAFFDLSEHCLDLNFPARWGNEGYESSRSVLEVLPATAASAG